MKLIKHLACQMMEEVEGAKEYAICALEQQYTRPQLSELYYKMAQVEMTHYTALHEQAVKLIIEFKEKGKQVPQKMLDKWDEEHKKMIECQQEAQIYINLYK